MRRMKRVSLKSVACAAASAVLSVDEHDLRVAYDSETNCWTEAWQWAENKEPRVLQNKVENYSVLHDTRNMYEEELQIWIRDRWLLPYGESKYGQAKGLIPLLAVMKHNEGKVRPVMDFRELKTHTEAFTADSDVCAAGSSKRTPKSSQQSDMCAELLRK